MISLSEAKLADLIELDRVTTKLDQDRWQAWGGIRFYLGESKSLIRRHREEDAEAEEQVTEVTEQTCAAYEQGRIASLLGMEGGHTIVMDGGVVAAS